VRLACSIIYFVRLIWTIRTVVYLFLINYGRSKADSIHMIIPNFLQVSHRIVRTPIDE
jgi:hypothetical protein